MRGPRSAARRDYRGNESPLAQALQPGRAIAHRDDRHGSRPSAHRTQGNPRSDPAAIAAGRSDAQRFERDQQSHSRAEPQPRRVQRMLQSPKLRGDFGEFTLLPMLRDLLPAEHYECQAPIAPRPHRRTDPHALRIAVHRLKVPARQFPPGTPRDGAHRHGTRQ